MIVRRVLPLPEPGHSDPECLADRKWWCFLLSSILSFIVGVFSVLLIRACAAVFCRKVEDYNPPDQKKQLEEEKRAEGGQGGDFMSGAKDWAGELISGQTGTGRILVSQPELKSPERKLPGTRLLFPHVKLNFVSLLSLPGLSCIHPLHIITYNLLH